MKTKRYSTEQIIGILKEADARLPVKVYAGKMASAMQPFTTGKRNMAVCRSAKPCV